MACGIGALAHGTDIAGSIRYPAYACGVHGLRPTPGRVPAWNASLPERPIGPQLTAVSGPLARTVADLRLGLAAMAAADPRDPWHVAMPLEGPPAPRRAALCVAPDGLATAPVLQEALREAGRRLAEAGWEIVEVGDAAAAAGGRGAADAAVAGRRLRPAVADNAAGEGDPGAIIGMAATRRCARMA